MYLVAPRFVDPRIALVLTYDKMGRKEDAAAALVEVGRLYLAAGEAAKAREAFVESRKRSQRPETFVLEGEVTDNLVATTGRVVIDEVTSTAIRGGAYLHYDADNTVNGRFEITICP